MEQNTSLDTIGTGRQHRSVPAIRAKFRVESYETRLSGAAQPGATPDEIRQVKLTVVYGDSEENKKYFKWTPTGQITLGLLNREAWEKLQLGQEVYVDFTPVNP